MKKKSNVYSKPETEREQNLPMNVDDMIENYVPENGSKCFGRTGSPINRDDIPAVDKSLKIAKKVTISKDDLTVNGFIDLTYFKREVICCGTIFKGLYGEVIIDPSLIKPCSGCLAKRREQQQSNVLRNSPAHSSASTSPAHSSASASPTHSVESGLDSTVTKQTSKYSDSSSDSGYDESSNQGAGEGKITKVIMNVNPHLKPVVKTQPIKSVQLKAIPVVSESVRLKSDVPIKLVPIKQIDQLSCKPLSLVSSTNVTLTGSSHTIVTVPANPLVDFAMHATPSRQSVSN
ncbi:hypothetical protein M0802_009897 [Mischocyttarus mexicanus]|nr:hypothetical protein M0802_009897 [Mischocyttarus mexicanus]